MKPEIAAGFFTPYRPGWRAGRQIKAGNFGGECPIQETGRQVNVQIMLL